MDERRRRRERATADAIFVPIQALGELYGGDPQLDLILEERGKACDAAGHTWLDPETRTLCTNCGSTWAPQSN